jgi:hypothetical protein
VFIAGRRNGESSRLDTARPPHFGRDAAIHPRTLHRACITAFTVFSL